MAIATSVDIGTLIWSRPDLHSGRPCLAGTGLSVRTVAICREAWGLSAEEILEQFPHLDLARIYAALAYYYANREAVDADIEAERAFGERLMAKYPGGVTGPIELPE